MPHDDQSELFIWVDENDRELGTITRAEAHSGTQKIHRSADVLLFNQNQQIVMQKRSRHKDTYPGFWTVSASGHVTYPQSYLQSAVRELAEELGYTSNQLTEIDHILYIDHQEKEIIHVFKAMYDSVSPLQFDPIEIAEIAWVDVDKLKIWTTTHPLTPAAHQVLTHLKYI